MRAEWESQEEGTAIPGGAQTRHKASVGHSGDLHENSFQLQERWCTFVPGVLQTPSVSIAGLMCIALSDYISFCYTSCFTFVLCEPRLSSRDRDLASHTRGSLRVPWQPPAPGAHAQYFCAGSQPEQRFLHAIRAP